MLRLVASDRSPRVALLVMRGNDAMALCPFFGKCDGVLVIDPETGAREFHASLQRTTDTVCDLVVKTEARRLILGFIGYAAAEKLRASGVDIRLGSCTCPVDDLAASFANLPQA